MDHHGEVVVIEGLGHSVPPECFDERTIFGDIHTRGQITISDVVAHGPSPLIEPTNSVALTPNGTVAIGTNYLPEHTVLSGTVRFEASLPGVIRNVILSALFAMEHTGLGAGRRSGYGRFGVRLTATPSPDVFLSYSWGSRDRMSRVARIARSLAPGCVLHFDQFETQMLTGADSSEVNRWMAGKVRSADRVVCLFTPDFKAKVEAMKGGVAFEASLVAVQSQIIAPQLQYVVGGLLEGQPHESIPLNLVNVPVVDLRKNRTTRGLGVLQAYLTRVGA